MRKTTSGFTIVELLIVIVVIAILAAISIVAYNGIQSRARNAKISSDISMLQKAIAAARINSGEVALRYVTSSTSTASACVTTATAIDISDKVAGAACWTSYNNALTKISNASNIDISTLVDPWGRPYFLDENEKEGATQCGIGQDVIATYQRPRTQDVWTTTNYTSVPYVTPGC